MSFELVSSTINGLVSNRLASDVSIERRLHTHATAHCTLETDNENDDDTLEDYAALAALGAQSLNAEVLLRWHAKDNRRSVDCFRGYVRAVRVEQIEHRSYLNFECISYSARLDQVRNFRVWEACTLQDICQYLIDKNKKELAFGEGGASVTSGVAIPLSVQYDETDFAYLTRMLHAWGIPLAVDDMNRKVLIGKPAAVGRGPFPGPDWHWNITALESEMIALQTEAQGAGEGAAGTARSKILEFNSGLNRTPGHRYEPRSDEVHHAGYTQMRRHEDETNFAANSVVCQARWMGEVFDYPPGTLAPLMGQEWLVREVRISGYEEQGSSEGVVQEFTLVDKLLPVIARYRRTPWPTQCLWAHVTKNNAEDPGKSGRVQVEFDWEPLEATGPASRRCWLPTVTPYGGLKGSSGTSGFLSLPEVGEHVLVQFLDGWDSDAVVLGSVRERGAQGFVYGPQDTKRWQTPSGNQVSLTTTDKGTTDIVEIKCRDKLIFRGEIASGKETVVMDLTGSGEDRIHYEKGSGPTQLDIFCSGSIYMHAGQRMLIEGGQVQIKGTAGPVKIDGAPLVQINSGPTSMQPLRLGTSGTSAAAGATTVQAGATTGRSRRAARGPFATQDEAARAALRRANPQSIRNNREYAGLIYRGSDGQYYYTGPRRGTDQGANPRSAPAPRGATVVGDYHTHGDYSTAHPTTGRAVRTSDPARDDFNSDNFSSTDRAGIAADGAGVPGYAGYLGTPSGTFRRYDPATGNDTVL